MAAGHAREAAAASLAPEMLLRSAGSGTIKLRRVNTTAKASLFVTVPFLLVIGG